MSEKENWKFPDLNEDMGWGIEDLFSAERFGKALLELGIPVNKKLKPLAYTFGSSEGPRISLKNRAILLDEGWSVLQSLITLTHLRLIGERPLCFQLLRLHKRSITGLTWWVFLRLAPDIPEFTRRANLYLISTVDLATSMSPTDAWKDSELTYGSIVAFSAVDVRQFWKWRGVKSEVQRIYGECERVKSEKESAAFVFALLKERNERVTGHKLSDIYDQKS